MIYVRIVLDVLIMDHLDRNAHSDFLDPDPLEDIFLNALRNHDIASVSRQQIRDALRDENTRHWVATNLSLDKMLSHDELTLYVAMPPSNPVN